MKETDEKQKIALTKWYVFSYNATVANAIGAWCNGNTWVSKTFVEGSNPSAPASVRALKPLSFKALTRFWHNN